MDLRAIGLFLLSAVALLGSPGPGIASLLAVGKSAGLSRGLKYYAGLQVGLALAAAVVAVGVISVFDSYPGLIRGMTWVASIYLVYLAYAIATSPVGAVAGRKPAPASPAAGLFLGVTNPKGYLAFASLLASPLRLATQSTHNVTLKWALCVAVILIVDLVWLWFGVFVGTRKLNPNSERTLNIVMGAAIVGATALGF
jgi:threonine/homoserine/homoserine lactone efflux protein